jgi:hypothetical protein
MRIQLALLLAFFACSVGHADVSEPVPVQEPETIAEGIVWRISDHEDRHGRFLPPWKEITITNIFGFESQPAAGHYVSVIPLDVNIPPLELRIIKTEPKKNPCDDHLPGWWEVQLESIQLTDFFAIAPIPGRSATFPFDVCLLYPPVQSARQIKKELLTSDMLPTGVVIDAVRAAIAITGDDKPDVVVLEYCCGDTERPLEACACRCRKTFKKTKGIWQLVRTSAPC